MEYQLHHITFTGKKDDILMSFLKKGIRISRGYQPVSHQRKGFYVTNNEFLMKRTGVGEFGSDIAREGKPLLVTVKTKIGPGWEADSEENPETAKRVLAAFESDILHAAPRQVRVREGYLIQRVEKKSSGLVFELTPEKHGTVQHFRMPWDKTLHGQTISESGLIQTLRDWLACHRGDAFLRHEAQAIASELSRSSRDFRESLSLKYCGPRPLAIERMELFADGAWKSITPTPGRSR